MQRDRTVEPGNRPNRQISFDNSPPSPNPRGAAPIGAVMVVGGGIAGMTASLDLANQGFKVYLIESQPAIGGKMAQLDKTFPTNDCAMCTISPKLAETGHHPNIEILTNADVLKLDGQAGDFRVQVRQRPRYVDPDKCVACDDCSRACPVIIPNPFEQGLASRRAIHKLYPQAVPNAYAIEKRGISPCRNACPAGQRAQGYIALIREGRWADALRVIKMDNPFPGICGRICNHRCETACNRGLVDEPVNIRALKRFVTDKIYAAPRQPVEPAPRLYEERVAIIGAGPCGLTAAQDLALAGYGVTVFEAMPVAGGMLRLGVPEYRLPASIIEREIQDIVDLGVELRLNRRIDNLDELFEAGYDAVLIAVGAHEGVRLPIPGADLEGVLINTRFLRDVRLGRHEMMSGKGGLGQRVLVLGGGNVAIDCARTAVRLGRQVQMACLEEGETIPAHPWEVEAAEAEGIILHTGRTFERILSDDHGRVRGVECMKVISFHFDETGRLHVEKAPNSEHVIECDTVIFSVGQRAGLAFIPDDLNVGLTGRRAIAVNPNTLATSRPGVFAAGDCISGTAFVIEAISRGHTAAQSINRYLRGQPLEPPPRPELPVVELTKEELAARLARGEIKRQGRVPQPELPVQERVASFAEVEQGYDDASAQAEAARCLACGVCSECMSCVFVCGRNAINHDDVARTRELAVGAVVLAPGYQIYNAVLSEEFGLGRYANVVTALQYERMLSASGPTEGHVRRRSDGKAPRRIAFLQCVGSRDQSHDYCSSVCCMYAAKEAVMTIEHARAEARTDHGAADVHCKVFFMDTRAYSKGYEAYYRRAQEMYGVEYLRCRLSDVKEDPTTGNLIVRYANPYQGQIDIVEEEFDLVVLSVGMEIAPSVQSLARQMGIELDSYGFCHTTLFDPLQSSRAGIYVAGPFREPKDIPETVVEASGAAAAAASLLSASRYTLTTQVDYPPERDVSGEPPRIGVFVCHCGSNIGGYLDVPGVATYARTLPNVIHAEDNLYTCSQDTLTHIIEQIGEQRLNRVVVASCTPLTHEPLFQDALRQAGLNPYLFDMANIRNQCSWVHSDDWEGATHKAMDLVRMAVARANQLQPLEISQAPVNQAALILGGGAAGMIAALTLAGQGFPVHLVERSGQLGGNLRRLRYLLPDLAPNAAGNSGGREKGEGTRTPQAYLAELEGLIRANPLITTYLDTELLRSEGFKGNFTSTLKINDQQLQVHHGVTIVATGGVEYRGPEYGYGQDERILTQLEFEALLADREPAAFYPQSVVMIQCIGPAEQYCSRLCCTTALKNALNFKRINPAGQVTILYRDIRTYGFKERLYSDARRAGVRFIHYEPARKPEVFHRQGKAGRSFPDEGQSAKLRIAVWEPILQRTITLEPDLLVLSMPVTPPADAGQLATRLRLSTDMDGFFLEAHVKLRPVDFASEGFFMAGLAHYPKLLDETIAQAQAAASRAALILSQETLASNASVAVVDPQKCVGCLTCLRVCPFDVPKIRPDLSGVAGIAGAAFIEAAVCRGCGSCAAECPAQAIQVRHFTDGQTMAKIDALFLRKASFMPTLRAGASGPARNNSFGPICSCA